MAARKKPTEQTLLTSAGPVLRTLTEDLLKRADSSPAMTTALRALILLVLPPSV